MYVLHIFIYFKWTNLIIIGLSGYFSLKAIQENIVLGRYTF
jgi:hypothetical protein